MLTFLGYLLYAVLVFLAFGWMLGVRLKPSTMYSTVLGSLYFTLLAIIIPFVNVNFLHLVWLIPLGFIISLISNFIFVRRVPLLDGFFRFVLSIYAGILRIGTDSNQMKIRRDSETQEFVEQWAKEKENDENNLSGKL